MAPHTTGVHSARGRGVEGIQMKNGRHLFFKVLFLLVLSAVVTAPALGQSARYALVIGNGNYSELGTLKNPVNDAHDIGEALKSLGFVVDSLADSDLNAMEDAVIRLGNRLSTSKECIGFFFYAGHGVQSNGINYLIPADAHIANANFLKTRALAAQEVLDTLQDAHNALNVVVLDACRDNPFSWARSGMRGLNVVAAQPPGSIIAYATSAGSVAQDGTARNGVFTAELLKNIGTSGIEIKDVFNRTGAGVQATTAGAQVPAIYNQYFGSAFLAGAATLSAGPGSDERNPTLTVQKSYGSLTVEVTTNGTLYLNGAAMGQVTAGSTARLDDIEAGQVSLEMRYADGKTETRTANVMKNAVVPIAFSHVPVLEQPRPQPSMVRIEGGRFQMGDIHYANDRPVHSVTVSGFSLGKTEVTQKEWRAIMGTDPSGFNGDDLPVENVSFYDALLYCNRLSVKEGLDHCYTINGSNVSCDFTKNGYRLPTEAEWEFAAKGGIRSAGYKYAGGDSIDAVGWYSGNSGAVKHPVGQKLPNELGLYDMTGNVWEWCWDRYGAYSASPQSNPRGAASGENRAQRGGAWNVGEMAVAFRVSVAPTTGGCGLRVAASGQ
jgi:formylglycine-generating enzyme required for sulfatase activity